MTTNPFPIPRNNRNLTILAWIVTLSASVLPDIIFDEVLGAIPVWIPFG